MKSIVLPAVLAAACFSASIQAQEVTGIRCTPKRYESTGTRPDFNVKPRACNDRYCFKPVTLPLDQAKKTDLHYTWTEDEDDDIQNSKAVMTVSRADGTFTMQKEIKYKTEAADRWQQEVTGTCEQVKVRQKF